jgi:hypothetical protein
VWIYTQSNITSIIFTWVHYTNTENIKGHPVLHCWISPNLGLKFDPLFQFVYFSFLHNFRKEKLLLIQTKFLKKLTGSRAVRDQFSVNFIGDRNGFISVWLSKHVIIFEIILFQIKDAGSHEPYITIIISQQTISILRGYNVTWIKSCQ